MYNSYEEKYWNVSETGFISIQCLETFNWLTYITYTHMQEQVFMHTHGYNLLLDTAVTEHLTPNSLWCRDSSSMTLQFDHLDKTSAPSGQESGAQPFVHLIQRQINLHWWKHTDNNSCLMSLSAKCRSLRINSALGQIPAKCSTLLSLITAKQTSLTCAWFLCLQAVTRDGFQTGLTPLARRCHTRPEETLTECYLTDWGFSVYKT